MFRSRSLSFIFITLVLDAMGIGIILPVMPTLLQEVSGEGLSYAAVWGGILSFSFALMQFQFAPLIGNISDQIGRRPVLMTALGVMALHYVIMAMATSLMVLLIARIIGGIAAATQATASAFIADTSSDEEKSANFGIIGAAFGVGFVLGPLIGGLLGEFGTRAPFWVAAGLTVFNLGFGLLVMPETVTDEIRQKFEWRRANPFAALWQMTRLVQTRALLTIYFLYEFSFFVFPAVWAYFTHQRYGWDTTTIGISFGFLGLSMFIVQGFLIRHIIAAIGQHKTLGFGLAFTFLTFLFLAFNNNGMLAFLATPLSALGAVATPALQGLLSNAVPKNKQGALQGVMTSTRSIAVILSPLILTAVFAATTIPGPRYFPGAVFMLCAGVIILCFAVFTYRSQEIENSAMTDLKRRGRT